MRSPALRIDRLDHGATVQLSVRGELDLVSASGLREAVAALDGTPMRHLVVDLRALEFVDAAGLHALAGIDAAARRNGHNASFVRAAPLVHRTFEIVGLADHLVFVDDPDDLRPPTPPEAA